MKVAVVTLASDVGMRFDRLAVEAEARGIDQVAVADHMHEPVGSATAATPEYFKRSLDPWVTLTAAAAVTSTIRLGTFVYLMAQRHPLVTAKAVASLDFYSSGRVELGVGWGWNRAEAEDYGVDWKRRRETVREYVGAARALWEFDEASYEGEFVRFGPCYQFPKPVQARVPVLVGCMAGPRNFAEVVDWSDGWVPMHFQVEDPPASLDFLRQVAEERGRDPGELTLGAGGFAPTLKGASRWRDLGASWAYVVLGGSATDDEVKRALDDVAHAAAALR